MMMVMLFQISSQSVFTVRRIFINHGYCKRNMGTFCLEKFNLNGDLVSRKCVINPFSKPSVEQDHPGFTVSEIGRSDNLCEHCPVYPPASGLSEQDVKDIVKVLHELLEEIKKGKTAS